MTNHQDSHGGPDRYHSYLLRLWRVSDRGRDWWRASLEQAATSDRLTFPSLIDLFDYLQAVISADRDPGQTGTPSS